MDSVPDIPWLSILIPLAIFNVIWAFILFGDWIVADIKHTVAQHRLYKCNLCNRRRPAGATLIIGGEPVCDDCYDTFW